MSDNTLIGGLNQLLADHAVYYQKLRNYHWNVKGPAFFQLHQKFEEMYLVAQEHVDSIAERILALVYAAARVVWLRQKAASWWKSSFWAWLPPMSPI